MPQWEVCGGSVLYTIVVSQWLLVPLSPGQAVVTTPSWQDSCTKSPLSQSSFPRRRWITFALGVICANEVVSPCVCVLLQQPSTLSNVCF